MAVKFNTTTGQTEDDSGPGLLDQVAGVVGSIAPPLGAAIKLAPMALEEGTPPAPEPGTTPAAPAASSPAAPAPAPAATPAPTTEAEPAAVPEVKTVTKTPEVTRHLTNPEELKADRETKAATDQGAKALELEARNRLKQAEIDQAKQDIEATQKRQEAQRAADNLKAAEARKKDIDAQAQRDQDAYQAAAATGEKGFWGSTDVVTKKQWALSLMFGNVASALGAENTGQKLLDKTMHDWTTERDKKLLRLQQAAEKSSGLQRSFWRDWGDEYKARKELQDAAAYATVADQIDAMNVKMRALIPAQAAAANAAKAADYRQRAADKRQAVVEQRFGRDQVRSGGTETTVTTGKPVPGGGQGRAATAAFNAARIAEHAQAALKTIDKLSGAGVRLTEDDLIRIQENRKETEKDKHAGLLEGKVMRGLHMVARTPYDGLSEKKRLLAQAQEVVMQKAAVLAAGGSTAEGAIDHARSIFDLHQPGQGEGGVDQKMDQIRGIVGANAALGGKFTKVAQAGADAATHAPAAAAGGGGVRKLVNGKPAMVYPDGTYEAL